MKTSIVISGRHDPTDARYKDIRHSFEKAGYQVVFHVPNWQLHSIEELVEELLQKIPNDKNPLTLFGFSLGAMIALVASTKRGVDNLILCSPSGYFKEYASKLTEEDMSWAHEHVKDFKNWSAQQTIHEAKVKHGYIVAGENELREWEDFKQWVDDLHAQTRWPLKVVPNVAHEIEALTYQESVKAIVQALG